jgi:hypothetical protein
MKKSGREKKMLRAFRVASTPPIMPATPSRQLKKNPTPVVLRSLMVSKISEEPFGEFWG